MARDKTTEVEVEVEGTQPAEAKIIRPNDLAKELGVDPKRLRAYLRAEFTRPNDAKNTNWELTPEMVSKATERFTASDEDVSDEDELDLEDIDA